MLKKLKEEGYILLAISGSHLELVEKIARYYGFDDWVGTIYKRGDTAFTGEKYVPSFVKKAALKKLISKHQLEIKDSYAVGDSFSDSAMLEIVENPIAFSPEKRLFEVARTKGWPVVIERKNMIYELELQAGKYALKEPG